MAAQGRTKIADGGVTEANEQHYTVPTEFYQPVDRARPIFVQRRRAMMDYL